MKKILSIFVLSLAFVFTASAQSGDEIFQNYLDKSGISTYTENYGDMSSLLELEIDMGPMQIPYKITSDGDGKYRVEMSAQGTNVLFIVRDGKAYVTAEGQTQVIEDEAQIAQMLPMTSVADILPSREKFSTLEYLSTEGKGKKECYLVKATAAEDGSVATIYFNTATGLIDKIVTNVEGAGEVSVVPSKYKEFVDGELTIPTVLTTKTPQGDVTINILNLEVDYPVAPWMFAAPKL